MKLKIDYFLELTSTKLQLLLARLDEGDINLAFTQSKLQGAQAICKPGEHQQACVVPGAEFELHCHARFTVEPWQLQVIVGPSKGEGLQYKVRAGIAYRSLGEQGEVVRMG